MSDWLESLKIGDEVAVTSRRAPMIARISHATKTTVLVLNMKFRRRDGRRVGCDSWDPTSIRPATDDLRAHAAFALAAEELVVAARTPGLYEEGAILKAADVLRKGRAKGAA